MKSVQTGTSRQNGNTQNQGLNRSVYHAGVEQVFLNSDSRSTEVQGTGSAFQDCKCLTISKVKDMNIITKALA